MISKVKRKDINEKTTIIKVNATENFRRYL